MCLHLVLLCDFVFLLFFFFKQKTAYEMRISDWSSDVCSSDLFAILHFLWLQHVCLPSDTVGRSIRRRVGFPFIAPAGPPRSEERRVGKECVSTCRYRWSP